MKKRAPPPRLCRQTNGAVDAGIALAKPHFLKANVAVVIEIVDADRGPAHAAEEVTPSGWQLRSPHLSFPG